MAQTFTKSDLITTLDATSPTLRPTSGKGGQGRVVQMRAMSAQISSTQATTVTNRMVRVPTNAFISKVAIGIDAGAASAPTLTTVTINVGLFYSDSTTDGTPAFWQAYPTAVSASFFAAAYVGAVTLLPVANAGKAPVDVTFANELGNSATDGFYTPGSSEYPLWDAIQNGGLGRVAVSGQVETSQGFGYSSGASSPFTTPANSGTVLTAPGDPGGWLDICITPSSTISATAAFYFYMIVDMVLG